MSTKWGREGVREMLTLVDKGERGVDDILTSTILGMKYNNKHEIEL